MDEDIMLKVMREMGRRGGRRRVQTTTPEQRTEWAKKAAAASAKVRSAKAKAKRKDA